MSDAPLFTELSARRLGPVRRFFARRPVAMDALVVLVFAAWALLMALSADSSYVLYAYLGGDRVAQMQIVSVVLTVLAATALVWRRRRPVAVALATGALGVVSLGATGATFGFELGAALALYAVASARRPAVAWLTTSAVVGALAAAAFVLPLPTTVGAIMTGAYVSDPAELPAVTESLRSDGLLTSPVWYQSAVPVLVLALLAVATGASARTRRLHLAAFLEGANALARDQEQRALLAQAAERARIAREMHDIVAHSLSVMVALGGGAAASLDWAPDRAKAALDDLVSTGRSALGDMRRVLGVLHEDGPAQGGARLPGGSTTGSDPIGGDPTGDRTDSAAPLEPQPRGVDLAVLLDRFRGTGLRVSAVGTDEGDLDDIDASLQLAVYRIVQEALTNALRHAPGTAAVEVEVRTRDEHVEVVVTDQGATVPVSVGQGSEKDSDTGSSQGSGRGLLGMRERAAVFGGTVEAGPYGGGWRVRALLPRRETDG